MDSSVLVYQQPLTLTCFGSEEIGSLDSLGQHEYDVLAQLFHERRSLPVYRNGLWCCYDCGFYSIDIEEVSHHLLQCHEACPPDEDDLRLH